MPTAMPESNRGSNATITMSREDLMALSVKKLKHLLSGSNATITMSKEDLMTLSVEKLKHLLKERDLPTGHAAKSTMADRLLKGKKKAVPKSNAERMAKSRASRSQAKVVADRARDAKYKRRSRSKPENRQAERERNAKRMAK